VVTIQSIVQIAQAAGRAILARASAKDDVVSKPDGSPVTAADRAAHALIVEALGRLDPSIPVVSEEGAAPPAEVRARWSKFWLVDPLDGTKEFLAGLPDYTVNIALVESGSPTMGVVDAPGHGLTYWASDGAGAWRQATESAAVRIYARPPAAGAPLRMVESRAHRSADLDAFARQWRVTERIAIGSSLKLCRIAEGRADVYPRFTPVMEWDIAAGDCVYRQSGLQGPLPSPVTYGSPELRVAGFIIGFTPPPAAVVWFTGLPGSGKTTTARAVRDRLTRLGAATELLDGDEIRAVFPNTGFSRPERDAHIRRVGHLASRLEAHGVTSLVSLVSPYRDSRQFARGLSRQFIEVYISTPASECERRDPKGLYAEARAGHVSQLTGVSDAYEPPITPDLTIDTSQVSVDEAADLVMARLLPARDGAAATKSDTK
jgi:3'(2'), 5'-bisphosphate nucleotidase